MDNNILTETFINHPAETLQWIVFVGALIILMAVAIKKIYGWIECYRTKRNNADEMIDSLRKNSTDINELREDIKNIVQKIDTMQESLSVQIQDLDARVTSTAEISSQNDLAILKDRIGQVYKYVKHKQHPYILDNDFNNYISLLQRYEALGGNGEVHEKIDPFIRSLPVFFSDEEAEAHFNENN